MKRRACLLAMVLALVISIGAPAVAADGRVLNDNWYVTLGGYLVNLSTDSQIGSSASIGTIIRAEDELGLDDQKSTFELQAERRLGRRHTIGLRYFDISRSSRKMLTDSIEFKGNTYDVGISLASEFDTRLIQFKYRYSFVNDGETEAGIQAGLSTWKLSAAVEGDATVDDGMGGVTTEFARAGENLLAPVPSVGMFVRHAITERLVFQASAGFFRLALGDVEARLIDTSLTLDYFFSQHVGIGVGLSGTDMRYEDDGQNPLVFDYRQNGFVAYVSSAF